MWDRIRDWMNGSKRERERSRLRGQGRPRLTLRPTRPGRRADYWAPRGLGPNLRVYRSLGRYVVERASPPKKRAFLTRLAANRHMQRAFARELAAAERRPEGHRSVFLETLHVY